MQSFDSRYLAEKHIQSLGMSWAPDYGKNTYQNEHHFAIIKKIKESNRVMVEFCPNYNN